MLTLTDGRGKWSVTQKPLLILCFAAIFIWVVDWLSKIESMKLVDSKLRLYPQTIRVRGEKIGARPKSESGMVIKIALFIYSLVICVTQIMLTTQPDIYINALLCTNIRQSVNTFWKLQ